LTWILALLALLTMLTVLALPRVLSLVLALFFFFGLLIFCIL
jgi:hypothetical protein